MRVVTFRKTASRSFRYLSLSLQNGVLRNQGDTGVRGLPTIKPAPITVQVVSLITRLPLSITLSVQSARRQSPVCAQCTKCRGSEFAHKFIQVSDTKPTDCAGRGVFLSAGELVTSKYTLWKSLQVLHSKLKCLPAKCTSSGG